MKKYKDRIVKTKLYKTINANRDKLLAVFILLTLFVLFLDTLKYPGFVGKHFLIDGRLCAALVLLFLLISATKSKYLKLVLKLNTLVLILVTAAYLGFSFIEAVHFPNYVLSTYHFSLDGLGFLFLFSFSLFLIHRIRVKKAIVKSKNIGYLILVFFVAYVFMANTGASITAALKEDFYVFTHLGETYDQKMYFRWKGFYNYMLFVKNNTPEDASIVIPPQIAPWWTRSGNLKLVTSFLYPRKIIQYDTKLIPDPKSLPPDTYIMIAWGEWECDIQGCKGWPEQVIKTKEAIFKDPNSTGVKEIRQNFTYDPEDTSNPFGLLRM